MQNKEEWEEEKNDFSGFIVFAAFWLRFEEEHDSELQVR